MSNHSIEYRGEVKINSFINGQYSNTKTMHNAGTNALFEYLCRALATDRVDNKWTVTLLNQRPQKIVLQGSENGAEWNNITLDALLIYSAVLGKVGDQPSVTFNGLLTSQNVKGDPYKQFRLVMQNEPGATLADVLLPGDGSSKKYEIGTDETQQIQWTMYFVNVPTTGGNE